MPKLIEYNVYERETKDASGKAKKDVSRILSTQGFEPLYQPSSQRYIRLMQQLRSILKLSSASVVVAQYPGHTPLFYRLLQLKDCTTIALLHDVESLRTDSSSSDEIELLSGFDLVVSHNASMSRKLRELGYKGDLIELELFDYLAERVPEQIPNYGSTVVFAGNLAKSSFVAKLKEIESLSFNLYGKLGTLNESDLTSDTVRYLGSFSSDEIPYVIKGSWGLVWDGPSLTTCANETGAYLRYNCPHKASLYITAGLPLIVWSESALADYVLQNNLGLAISSLEDLPRAIQRIDPGTYNQFVTNVRAERGRTMQGVHTKNVLELALSRIRDKATAASV